MYHPLSRDHLYCATKITATFSDYGVEKSGAGTSFFVKSNDGSLYLITNRHVVDAGYSDVRKRHWNLTRIMAQGHCEGSLKPFAFSFSPPNLCFPENDAEDVAVIKMNDVACNGDLSGPVIPINSNYLARSDDFPMVEISDIVAFPVFHGTSDQPVMRTGWVASDASRDFSAPGIQEAARRIAIDGFSWGGYSGSPVFTLDKGFRSGDGIIYGGGFRESKLIGVNAGHIKVADGSGAHAGLSYLIKSSVLIDLLDL